MPCIAGKLFFEYSDCGLSYNKQNIFNINNKSPENHHIIISSTVNWKDYHVDDLDGLFRVIVVANSHEFGEIKGDVYIITDEKASENWDEIDSKLLNLSRMTLNDESIKEDFPLLRELLEEEGKYFYKVNFSLDQLGFTKLRLASFPSKQPTDQDKNTICRQAYYYIKYAFHKHRHHHTTAESLTTIHPLTEGDKTNNAMELISDLKRSLVQIKRNFKDYQYQEISKSIGIISYALSLIESCKKSGYITPEDYQHEKSYFENVSTSLSVLSTEIEKNVTHKSGIANSARSFILFLLAIVAPFTIIYKEVIIEQLSSTSTPIIVKLIAFTAGNDATLIFLIISLILFYFLHYKVISVFGRYMLAFKYFRNYLGRLTQRESKTQQTGLLLILMVISLGMIFIAIKGALLGL